MFCLFAPHFVKSVISGMVGWLGNGLMCVKLGQLKYHEIVVVVNMLVNG